MDDSFMVHGIRFFKYEHGGLGLMVHGTLVAHGTVHLVPLAGLLQCLNASLPSLLA